MGSSYRRTAAAPRRTAATRGPRVKRTMAVIGVVLALCLGVVVTRAIWEGRSALATGDSAQAAGDRREAIAQWRRAARWYVPGAPHVGRAYDRLENLALVAEREGDLDTALRAWRGVRGSILATRSFYTPFSDRLEPANRNIARLMASVEGAQADPARSEAERAEWHYDLLARNEAPSVAWTLFAMLGMAIWLGGGLLFALRGLSGEDRLNGRVAVISGALVASGLLLWMLGLYNA